MVQKNGITVRANSDYRTSELPELIGIHQNLLRTPICTLSEKAAHSLSKITSVVGKGLFSMSLTQESKELGLGLPTAKHAEYFYALCGYLADNWNEKGIVYFRFSDVLKALGKNPRSANSMQALKETIRRYQGAQTKWVNCFDESSKDETITFPLIRASSLFKSLDDEEASVVNARNTKNKKNWNWIQFDPFIVEACDPRKNPQTRLFLSSIFKANGRECENIVYRYFYGMGDLHYQWHSIYRSPDGLINQFHWTGPKHKFLPWLERALNGLFSRQLVEKFEFSDTTKSVRVKCRSITDLHSNPSIDILSEVDDAERFISIDGKIIDVETAATARVNAATRNKRKGARKCPEKIENLTPQALMEEYLARKERGLLDKSKIEHVDAVLGLFAGKPLPEYILAALRNVLSS